MNSGLCHPSPVAAGDTVIDQHGRPAKVLFVLAMGQRAVVHYLPGTLLSGRDVECSVRDLMHVKDVQAALAGYQHRIADNLGLP